MQVSRFGRVGRRQPGPVRLLHFRAARGLFVPKPSRGAIRGCRTAADLLALSVNVRRCAWAAGGIITS